jgi:hypothetical protein
MYGIGRIVTMSTAMKVYWTMAVRLSALKWGCSASILATFIQGEAVESTHRIGEWLMVNRI